MRQVLLTLLILSVVTVGTQEDWKREPNSFLGVKFGEPLSSSYPECPTSIERGKRTYAPVGGATCWEQNGNDAVLIRAGEFFGINIQSIDGKVASISASFKHSDFSKIAAKLIAQYGEPQWRNHPTVDMKDGRKLPSDGLNWFGKNIEFFCASQSPIEGEGMLGMSNKAWTRLMQRIASQ